MNPRTIFFFLVALTVLFLSVGYALWQVIGERGEIIISGIIESDDVHVGSKVGGRVLRVVGREGERVQAGEVLVLLEPYELESALAEAQASLRQAQARLKELLAGYRKEEIEQAEAAVKQQQEQLRMLLSGPRQQEIDQAKADWLAAKALHENAERFRRRAKDLAERELIARQEYDDATAKADEAEQRMKAARERYDLLLAGTREEEIARARHRLAEAEARLRQLRSGFREEEVAQARAAADAARARVELIRTQLAETVIRAPVNGLIEVLDLQPGDLVGAGKPVATILRTESLWVRAYLPEDKLGFVKPGLEVAVRVDSFPEKRFPGRVRRVRRQAEFTPRNIQTREERVLQVFQVEVALEDREQVLRPGMNADVFIPK